MYKPEALARAQAERKRIHTREAERKQALAFERKQAVLAAKVAVRVEKAVELLPIEPVEGTFVKPTYVPCKHCNGKGYTTLYEG